MKKFFTLAFIFAAFNLSAALDIKNSSDLDKTWKEYFQTKNKDNLVKILQVINADTVTTFCSYEYLNRLHSAALLSKMSGEKKEANVDDLEASMAVYEKKNPGFTDKVHLATAAMWSMDDALRKNPQVKEDFQAIIQENPGLDYPKKIKLMLEHKE